jgi:hypothetical protein
MVLHRNFIFTVIILQIKPPFHPFQNKFSWLIVIDRMYYWVFDRSLWFWRFIVSTSRLRSKDNVAKFGQEIRRNCEKAGCQLWHRSGGGWIRLERVWQCDYWCFLNNFLCQNIYNDVFLFFKNHFWHQHIKTIKNVQTILNFNKKFF